MERSCEQLKRVERLSRQTRHYRTHLNQMSENQLHQRLDQLEQRRDQNLLRCYSRQQIEEERQNLVHLTVKDIARERRQIQSASKENKVKENLTNVVQTEIEREKKSRPSSSIQMPREGQSCRLFSHNCQLYPCQPVYQYTSFVRKENDRCLIQRENFQRENLSNESTKDWTSNRIQEKKYYQNRRQITLARHNQNYLVNRYVSLQRTQNRLNEESQRLHERLAERKLFGRVKEHRHQLTQDIQRHLQITAKFCA